MIVFPGRKNYGLSSLTYTPIQSTADANGICSFPDIWWYLKIMTENKLLLEKQIFVLDQHKNKQ